MKDVKVLVSSCACMTSATMQTTMDNNPLFMIMRIISIVE